MNTRITRFASPLLGLLVSGTALAQQGQDSATRVEQEPAPTQPSAPVQPAPQRIANPPASVTTAPPTAPSAQVAPAQWAPPPSQPPSAAPVQPEAQEIPPPAAQWVYSYPSGQWVYTTEHGWVWVPLGASSAEFEGTPYAYMYTPVYGWNWYVAPWGLGPYRYGAWVVHPWRPVGWRGGWVAHPTVVVHLGGYRGAGFGARPVIHGGGFRSGGAFHGGGFQGGGFHGGGFHGGGFHGGGFHGGGHR
jgi:hypothetical protein